MDTISTNRVLASLYEHAHENAGSFVVENELGDALGIVEHRKPRMWMARCYGRAQSLGIVTIHARADDAAEAVIRIFNGEEPLPYFVIAVYGRFSTARRTPANPRQMFFPPSDNVSVIQLLRDAERRATTTVQAPKLPTPTKELPVVLRTRPTVLVG